jgi:hypothetical protein
MCQSDWKVAKPIPFSPFHSSNWPKSLQPSYEIETSPPANPAEEASSSEILQKILSSHMVKEPTRPSPEQHSPCKPQNLHHLSTTRNKHNKKQCPTKSYIANDFLKWKLETHNNGIKMSIVTSLKI